MSKFVQIKASRVHAKGLYAKCAIAEDTPIIEYIGDKVTRKQAENSVSGSGCIYWFELNQRYLIDGDVDENIAKYINHACDPNCYIDIIKHRIWVYALRDIKKGEELSYDYGFERTGWHERPCRCRSEPCFGFIVARGHRSSIQKTKRYQRLVKSIKI